MSKDLENKRSEENSILAEQFLSAVKAGNIEEVNKILQTTQGKELTNYVDKSGNTALTYAAEFNHITILELLLKNNHNPQLLNHSNNEVLTALMIAVIDDNYKAVELLLEAGANPNHTERKKRQLL